MFAILSLINLIKAPGSFVLPFQKFDMQRELRIILCLCGKWVCEQVTEPAAPARVGPPHLDRQHA